MKIQGWREDEEERTPKSPLDATPSRPRPSQAEWCLSSEQAQHPALRRPLPCHPSVSGHRTPHTPAVSPNQPRGASLLPSSSHGRNGNTCRKVSAARYQLLRGRSCFFTPSVGLAPREAASAPRDCSLLSERVQSCTHTPAELHTRARVLTTRALQTPLRSLRRSDGLSLIR